MPLYADLARRAVEAAEQAGSLRRDSRRIKYLAQILRCANAGQVSIRRCAWCDRYQVGGEWLHLEAIGAGQTRIRTSLHERATNGICPDCFDREIRRTRAGRERARRADRGPAGP